MRETRTLEFKESITNTFLKTVSAFANYGGGEILFGVDDNGNVVGIEDPQKICLDIENKINDSITPNPEFLLEINQANHTIKLTVKSGVHKPYLYKSKAYKRNDSATIEVDRLEFSRLVLEGENTNYEEVKSSKQDLTFEVLEEKLKEIVQIEELNLDILRTLNLYENGQGYNNAAALVADHNQFPGVDIAKFGENISIIQKRKTYSNMSVLQAYDKTIDLFRDFYTYEKIQGAVRQTEERISEAAFREALANAFIHRVWDLDAQIRISMYDDRIEIVSPGGLPTGISKEEYLAGRISVLRNPILANVFYRLRLVEIFGSGIARIKQIYAGSAQKPQFAIGENTIMITLPLMTEELNLSEDEQAVYSALSKNNLLSMSEILAKVTFGKSKTTQLAKALIEKGYVIKEGTGRGTKYRIISD